MLDKLIVLKQWFLRQYSYLMPSFRSRQISSPSNTKFAHKKN